MPPVQRPLAPRNPWRDTIDNPLHEGEMFFLLLARALPGDVWRVEDGPGLLWIMRSREKQILAAGYDTRVVRCVTLAFDPTFAGLVPPAQTSMEI